MTNETIVQTSNDQPLSEVQVPETLGSLAAGKENIISSDKKESISSASDIPAIKEEVKELIDGKFKTVDDLLKSYKELQKKKDEGIELKKHFGVPENGEYINPIEDPELAEKFTKKAGPAIDLLKTIAKENNFSQDMYNNLFDKLSDHVTNKLQASRAELLTLENAGERLQTLNNWFGNNFDFSEFPSVANVPMTKDMLVFFESVKTKMTGGSNMSFGQPAVKPLEAKTLEGVMKEMASKMDLYKTDESYRKAMQTRIADLERQQGANSYNAPKFK